MMMMIDVDTKNGGMPLNNDFLVDFGDEPGGPVCGHEIRWNISAYIIYYIFYHIILYII